MISFENDFYFFAGPCSLESKEHIELTFKELASYPLTGIRCALFKARTNPEAFQGLGLEILDFVKSMKAKYKVPALITEVTDAHQIPMLEGIIDVFQVGTRNMFNYELLKALDKSKTPVLLKRNFAATIDEWIQASKYLSTHKNIFLCERGVRTFETKTRNTMDIGAVAYLKKHTDFLVVVDPSHGTGRRELVEPVALACVQAGADGLIVEAHHSPEEALSDGFQSLDFKELKALIQKVHQLRQFMKNLKS